MKANYNRKINIKEKSVCFRVKNQSAGTVYRMDVYQSNLYGNELKVKDTTYLDFENEEQVDNLIKGLKSLKGYIKRSAEEVTTNESETEPR